MFSNLLKSNFGDSATPLTSPIEPRLKTGQDAATAPPPPESFQMGVGERRVPRQTDPKKPTYEMIKDARKGVLSGFLRSGKIIRASDFVGFVNPKTSIITLNNIYDFETRCLAAIDHQPTHQLPLSSMVPFKKVADKEDDDGKNLRNLFFIALAHDELPSFHFWTKPGDEDPVTAGESTDWGKHFDENPPSPATTAKIATLENERKEKAQRGAEEKQNSESNQPLGFLDPYYNINLPDLGGEPTQGQPSDDGGSTPQTSAAPILTQSPLEAEVLLQFNRGGMYLREFTHKALYGMACWLVENEEDDEEDEARNDQTGIDEMFLDISESGKDPREERIVSVSRVSNRNFQDKIKPSFGRPDIKFRVRSTRYQSWWNLSEGFDSGGVGNLKYDLKLVRPNVGYCYISANWHIAGWLHKNSKHFEKALQFLFDWKLSAYAKSNRLSLDIPGHGSFDLDRNSDVVVEASIQSIFAELSVTPTEPDSRPVEIFIRDIAEDVTDGSDFLGPISPRHPNAEYDTGTREAPDVLQATETGGGPDVSSIHARLLTNSEINKLQERLQIAEASIVETDDLQERLRVAEEKLVEMSSLQGRLKTSEGRAKLRSSCPFCPQDWAGVTKQQQQDHLKLHQKNIVHQPAPQQCPQPDCASWLGENQEDSTYEAISQHLRLHIEQEHAEDSICEYQHCHANMYALTAQQQDEHESTHRDTIETKEDRHRLQEQARSLEETLKKPARLQEQVGNLENIEMERDQLQAQAGDLEDTATERDRLHQQIRQLQDVTNERDRLRENLVDIRGECDSFQARAVELERRLKAAAGLDEGMQTKSPEPETEVDEDPRQPSQSKAPKKLRYCNVCLKSVDKLSDKAKTKHADKCETSVSEFLLLTPAGAKVEREKRNNGCDIVRSQAPKGTEKVSEVLNTGKKRKQKALAKAAPSESQQDKAEDANTTQQPEASKATGRKTAKRKIDRFKPPREDESDEEELESPRKKPKLKAKAAKAGKRETAPASRSTRSKDLHGPREIDEDEDGYGEEAYNEPSSSAKGGKGKKKATAANAGSKKAKAKK